jgi:hypothetical protein
MTCKDCIYMLRVCGMYKCSKRVINVSPLQEPCKSFSERITNGGDKECKSIYISSKTKR